MSKYRDLAKKALSGKKEGPKQVINENLLYGDGITERMHTQLEEALRRNQHSLSECGMFPDGDVVTTEMKLIRERFRETVMAAREAFDMSPIDNNIIMSEQMPLVKRAMTMEGPNKKKLEELAIEMVMEEFDIPEGSIIMEAELRPNITREGTIDVPMESLDEEFQDHDEKVRANEEVNKRRAVNSIIQGAANCVNPMFHMKHQELSEMDERLPGTYKKMMAAADYMFFIVPDLAGATNAGSCEIDMNEDEDGLKPVIKAKGMVFPVLIHELVKGVMEVLATHGQPTQENVAKYVIEKADFVQAEAWDTRFGVPVYKRITQAIPAEDFGLKHHVFVELFQLPPHEFNSTMKEIIEKTKRGKQIIKEIIKDVKKELQEDDYNEAMGDRDDLFDIEDLL